MSACIAIHPRTLFLAECVRHGELGVAGVSEATGSAPRCATCDRLVAFLVDVEPTTVLRAHDGATAR